MSELDVRRSSLRQQPPAPPPQTTLPSIPHLPPISLASSPSIESFATAMSTTSRDRELQRTRPVMDANPPPSLSFTPPASPSSFFASAPRQIRTASSVQHLRTTHHMSSGAGGGELSDYSDLESSQSNRATPVPSNYRRTPMPASYTSDTDRHPSARRYDSERDEPAYQSSASMSRGGTMSDSHTATATRSLSARPSSSAFQARLHAVSVTSNTSASSSGSSFFGGRAGAPSSPTTRPSMAAPQPPSGKPLPTPGSSRIVNRARSASLLGMVSTVAANIPQPKDDHPLLPRSASSVQNLQKPRLALHPASTPTNATPEFTLLVVGSPQCGKSVLISKGLKSWNLEKERTVTLGSYTSTVHVPAALAASLATSGSYFPSGSGGGGSTSTHTVTHEIRAISRIAHVAIKNATYPIETLEVASQELFLAGPAWPAVIANGQWAAGQGTVAAGVQAGVAAALGMAPPLNPNGPRGRVVDGLVVCYDSSDTESWQFAKTMLEQASHAYVNQPIQAIVVACKTDLLNPPVPADHTEYHPLLSGQSAEADHYQIGMLETTLASQARSHRRHSSSDDGRDGASTQDERRSAAGMNPVHKNLGLVPVARTEGMGKKKMRDAFGWLLRRVERAKRHHRTTLAAQGYQPATSKRQSSARTPTPTPPSAVDAPTSFWPASIGASTPPADRYSPSQVSAGMPSSSMSTATTGSSGPMSPLSTFSSPGGLQLSLSQPPLPSSSLRSPRSPTSPTRARSTSDLTLEYARGGAAAVKEEQDREYAAMVAAARGGGNTSGVGSGTERENPARSSGSVMGKRTSASVSNLRSRAESAAAASAAPRGSISTGGVPVTAPTKVEDGETSRRGSGAAAGGPNGHAEGGARAPSMNMSMLPMKLKEPPPLQYATLDELLDKLVFLGVSGEEPVFSDQFFLVYRRFATPRSVLLGFQKRMRELSTMTDDLLLAKYAQMRMCRLLEQWMDSYPGDFAAPGAEPALTALVRQLISLCHTAHYGSDFMAFVEVVPELVDEEKAWALKEERRDDDRRSDMETDGAEAEAEALRIATVSIAVSMGPEQSADSLPHSGVGESAGLNNNSSHRLPHSASMNPAAGTSSTSQVTKSSISHIPMFGDYNTTKGLRGPDVLPGTKPNMKELAKASTAIVQKTPQSVAEEITRLEVPMFLSVQPRDWLRHGLGEKGHEDLPDTIPRMAKFYNYLTMWTASLILVHDKPRSRAKTIEFFIRVAVTLRKLNNYSGLRAVVMGISTSRTDRELDPVMSYIKDRHLWKKEFKSLETLLGTSRMHSAYRMALRHTFDAAIPSMEIHTYDLIRADDTNPDYKPGGDGTLIHWGKFVMMAKMVLNVTSYQEMFPDSTAFTFPERPDVRELIMNIIIMDDDTLYARIVLPIEPHAGGPLSDGGGTARRIRDLFARR